MQVVIVFRIAEKGGRQNSLSLTPHFVLYFMLPIVVSLSAPLSKVLTLLASAGSAKKLKDSEVLRTGKSRALCAGKFIVEKPAGFYCPLLQHAMQGYGLPCAQSLLPCLPTEL